MFLSYCQCHHLPNPKFQNTKPLREAETRGVLQSIRKASTRNIGSLPKFSRNNSSYASFLQHCSRERLLVGGLQLHADMIKAGFDSDTYLQSSLLSLYVRCESLDCVRKLFRFRVLLNLELNAYLVPATLLSNSTTKEAVNLVVLLNLEVNAYPVPATLLSNTVAKEAELNFHVPCGEIPYSELVLSSKSVCWEKGLLHQRN